MSALAFAFTGTMSRYVALRFARTMLVMMLSLLVLIVVIDFVEQLRKAAERPDLSALSLLQLSALKAPVFLDKAFVFGCLFAAMVTLTQLNQKMELVVARAAGISAWGFLMPVLVTAAAMGAFAAFAYNPLAIVAAERAKSLEVSLFSDDERLAQGEVSGIWLRQSDGGGASTVINARLARLEGRELHDVRLLRFDAAGAIAERIDARAMRYEGRDTEGGRWLASEVRITGADLVERAAASYELDTPMTPAMLLGATAAPDSEPFWKLPEVIAQVERAGGSADPYRVQFQSLLAQPLFMLAMVVIAATVCLRFSRFGQIGRLLVGGVVSGFVLYAATRLVTSLGANGIVSPVVAAWSPALVALVFGATILLHQEDG